MKLMRKNYPYLRETIYEATLENGLRVTLLPKQDFHETYGIVTVGFGSVDTKFTDESGIKREYPLGIAHFLEHKLFETADGGDVMQEFSTIGASSNAYTSLQQTSYLFSTTEEVLASLELLQDFTSRTHFTEESVEREKDIIAQEIEMYQDDADHRLYQGILGSLYPQTALADDIAGTVESVQTISAAMLVENFQQFYRPSNMTLFVIGHFDVDEVWGQICANQAQVATQSDIAIKGLDLEKLPIIQHAREEFEVALPKLAIGLRGNDTLPHEKLQSYRLCLTLLFAMLMGTTSKRYQDLYETGKIDSSLSFHIEVQESYHFIVVTGDTEEPITVSNQLRKAIQQFEQDKDVTEEHLQLVKNDLYGDFIRSLNSLEFVAGYFSSHSSAHESIFDIPEIVAGLTLADVIEVGRAFITACDMTDFMIFPK